MIEYMDRTDITCEEVFVLYRAAYTALTQQAIDNLENPSYMYSIIEDYRTALWYLYKQDPNNRRKFLNMIFEGARA